MFESKLMNIFLEYYISYFLVGITNKTFATCHMKLELLEILTNEIKYMAQVGIKHLLVF